MVVGRTNARICRPSCAKNRRTNTAGINAITTNTIVRNRPDARTDKDITKDINVALGAFVLENASIPFSINPSNRIAVSRAEFGGPSWAFRRSGHDRAVDMRGSWTTVRRSAISGKIIRSPRHFRQCHVTFTTPT